jgi:cell division protein FtsZ
MHEVNEAAKIITSSADEDAKIIFGAVIDPKFKDEIKITVVATGFNSGKRPVGTSSIAPERNYNPAPFIEDNEDHHSAPAKSKASALKIAQAEPAAKKPSVEEEEDDELSIPTFIRKKML